MKNKMLSKEERDELARLYLHTKIGQMELVQRYGVSLTTVQNIIKKYRNTEGSHDETTTDNR